MNSTHQSGSRQASSATDSKTSSLAKYQQILIGVLCIALTIAAYKCVVQKSFLGDDHVHLVWLNEAVKDPSLVLRNFWSNWLYSWTSPQCYRPLISVFMFTDYLVWHRNAVGFHITNLLFLGLSSVALYGCVSEVLRWSPSTRLRLWPLLAAGTFALYPSHPESVSWVTGRVDAVVTAFYLCSTYTWMIWRRTADKRILACSILSMMLSLASKEMAVTIPVTLFCFEFFRPASGSSASTVPTKSMAISPDAQHVEYGPDQADAPAASVAPSNLEAVSIKSVFMRLRSSLFVTAFAWVVLIAYFVLRKLALGTFVGGYDDTLAANGQLLLQHWMLGLNKVFVPINAYYATENAWLVTSWTILTVIVYAISLFSLLKKGHRSQLLFFATFAAVSFVPVYKLFDGLPDLQGSRFSYLASAPIAAFFAFGLAWFPSVVRIKNAAVESILQMSVIVIYFLAAAYMLWLNNQPWMTAGRWVSTLEKQFNQTMAFAKPGDKFVYFNIPNNYRGAYLARNAIGDIGQNKDIDWKALETDDKLYELGQTRNSIAAPNSHVHCYYWSESLGSFLQVNLPPKEGPLVPGQWNMLLPSEQMKVVQGAERVSMPRNTEFSVVAGPKPVMILLDLSKLQPWQIDFIALINSAGGPATEVPAARPALIVSDELMPTQQLSSISVDLIDPSNGKPVPHTVRHVFPLRLLPGWFCGNAPSALLLLPPATSGRFGVRIPEAKDLLPVFKRTSTARYITEPNPLKCKIDVSGIDGATGALIQISKKNTFFSTQNTRDFEEKLTGKTVKITTPIANLTLTKSDFTGGGQYQVRCWAVGKDGKIVGLSSDYLMAIVL